MSTVFFDTKNVRHSEMLCRNKNHASVLHLKPMTFLVKRNPTALPNRTVTFQKSDKSKIISISLHQLF